MSQIQNLIAAGRLKDALTELARIHPDAILLKGQYAAAERENGLGILEGGDYRRTINKITHSALEIARQYSSPIVVDQSVHVTSITINMTGTDFAGAVASMHMDTLINQCNTAFKGTPIMSEYLDIRHTYQKQVDLGVVLAPNFIAGIKAQIVDMYTKFVTEQTTKKSARQYQDVTDAYQILKKEQLNKDEIEEACDLLLLFLVDNPGYVGRNLINDVREEIGSDTFTLLEKRRADRAQERINFFQSELSQMVNRILSSLEK